MREKARSEREIFRQKAREEKQEEMKRNELKCGHVTPDNKQSKNVERVRKCLNACATFAKETECKTSVETSERDFKHYMKAQKPFFGRLEVNKEFNIT